MSSLDDFSLHDFPDRAIRTLLENPRNLAELIGAVVPDLAGGFDFDRAEPVPRGFLMEDWRRRESDLLFQVPFRTDTDEQPALVCVLIEHQSAPDPRMPLRILLYAMLYWERQWKTWEEGHPAGETLRLTPVLPIVFHTGPDRWRVNRQLADLMGGPESLRQFAPQWPVLFWDLAERTPEELIREERDWLRVLAIVRAERADAESFAQVFHEVLRRLEPLSAREEMRWHDLMTFALSWAFHRRPRSENQQLKQLAADSHRDRRRKREVKAMSQTLGQTWDEWALEEIERRSAEAQAEGLAKGQAKGEIRARRDDLLCLLQEKFGELPDEMVRRIEATTDVERLKSCLRQILRIQSLEELNLTE